MKKITFLFVFIIGAYNFIFAQDIVNLTTTQTISDALSSYSGTGDNVVLIVPAGYTNPQGTTLTDLTTYSWIKASTKLTIKGDGTMPTANLSQFKLPIALTKFEVSNLVIVGPNTSLTSNYLVNMSDKTTAEIDSFVISNCIVEGYRSMLRFQNTDVAVKQRAKAVVIRNSVFRNFPDYGVVYNNKAASFMDNISVNNCTFYGMFDYVLNIPNNITSVNVSNSTFDNVGLNKASPRNVVNLGSQTTPINFSNNIVGRSLTAGALINGGTITISNSYLTSDATFIESVPAAGTTASGAVQKLAVSASVLFKTLSSVSGTGAAQSTTVGDYTIIDNTFVGKSSAGDPRWYAVSTSINNVQINSNSLVSIYTVEGKILRKNVLFKDVVNQLKNGIYIVNNKKLVISR